MAKLCLNKVWGRLRMRENKPTTKHLTRPEEFFILVLSRRHCVTSFDVLEDDVLQVGYWIEPIQIQTLF